MAFSSERRWPRWTPGRGAGGRWKQRPDDFAVEELPLAPPTGTGTHQWLRVEKVGRTTPDVAAALARAAGVDLKAVGYAGLKDKEARTIQHFTVEGGKPVRQLPPGMSILAAGVTQQKLHVGQLLGNRFRIRIVDTNPTVLQQRLARLTQTGMPNYYGLQRVGGDAPEIGRALLVGRGPRLTWTELKFSVSAYQALLFNQVLARRGPRRLEGDLLLDGQATGPIYGHQMPWPTGAARALEEAVLAEEELPADALQRFPSLTRGTRRSVQVRIDAQIELEGDSAVLTFFLPSGSYATVLLEELL